MEERCEAQLEKGICLNSATITHWRGSFCTEHDPGEQDQCEAPTKDGKRCLKWATVERNHFAYCKDCDPGEAQIGLTKKQFISTFVANFLSTWCATHYDANIHNGTENVLYEPPIEDAFDIAARVWNNILKLRE